MITAEITITRFMNENVHTSAYVESFRQFGWE